MPNALSEEVLRRIEAAKLRSISRTNPLLEDLPDWVTAFRPHQISAIERIVSAFDSGTKVVVLDAPTGSGKTLIAETVRRLLKVPCSYVCSSKSLQDQFVGDFPYARVLKGRGNYPTLNYPGRFKPGKIDSISTEDCTATKTNNYQCRWCGAKNQCPYERAKKAALLATVAVLNTSYFLAECNNIGRFSGGEFTVADEADTLESSLMGYVSVEIGERRMEKYGWQPPKKVTVASSWAEWLDEIIPQATALFLRVPAESDDVRDIREGKYLSNLVDKLTAIRSGLDDGYWVYTGKDGKVSFKPSRVDSLGQEYLWKHSNKFLLMSATVISPEEMLDSLGYEGSWESVSVGSTFPIENRKVFVKPVVDMANKNKEIAWPKVGTHVAEIVARHDGDRVLVHSVSYDLTRAIVSGLQGSGRQIITYTSASEREAALSKFRRSPRAIMVAPSLDRGVDLPGDLCRVQIIVKVPFLYLGDRQVSARLHSRGGQVWYTVQAIRTLVQMTGRAVRSSEDWAVTYILDAQFNSQLWSRGRNLFPQWWRDGLIWERPKGMGR